MKNGPDNGVYMYFPARGLELSRVSHVKVVVGIRVRDGDSFPDFWHSHSGFSWGLQSLYYTGDAHRTQLLMK